MPTRPPNVVLLLADQWRGTDQGWRGNADVRTPRLDRLAETCVAVRGAYANAPVCGPSRACLLTGQLPHTNLVVANDLPLPRGIPTITEVLAGNGYHTGWIGKWHLDGVPRDKWVAPQRRHGFAYWAGTNCTLAHFDSYYHTGADPTPVTFGGYEPLVQTDLALRFIEHNRERPFFLAVSYNPPHDPYEDVPEEYLARYDPAVLTPRANAPDGADMRRTLRQYYAAISAIDDQVGRVVDGLYQLGLDDDTLIVVTSDHGDMLGSHDRWAKQVPFEESVCVPLVFSWGRRLGPRQIREGAMGLVDLSPTLLGLVGAPALPTTYGADLSDAIAGDAPLRDAVLLMNAVSCDRGYQQGVPEWRGFRSDDTTHARRADGTPWLMFDNDRDPWQLRNLVDGPDARASIHRADQRLDALLTEAGDTPASGAATIHALGLVDAWNARERELHGNNGRVLNGLSEPHSLP